MTSYILKPQFDLTALVSKGYFKLLPLGPTQKLEDLSGELAICTHNGDGNTYRNKISSNNSSIIWINQRNTIIALVLVLLITGVIIGWKKRNEVNRTYNLLSKMFTQEHLEEEEIHERRRASTTISNEAIPLLYISNVVEKLKKELPSEININKLYLDLEYEFNINGLKYVGVRESARSPVKIYIHKLSKFSLAIKFLRIPFIQNEKGENSKRIKKLKEEIINLKKISPCLNVVDLYGICFHEGEILICMELMDFSFKELYIIVHKKSNRFSEKLIGYVTASVLKALMFCKEFNVIHRDIKPSNVLLHRR
uniref:mitogen-activated protein kinase kinase n=1 Tax=Acrobeloides nanus TaxID=290746 RepID=A0A914DMS7_9BILA